ncbi:Protein phosphatase CheZ [Sulfidibacter corallicola]|uniref:Protein phosphatase CheZ n=1 Tax=Sulfidibacter corallicola TaxID=2818388 RepID=A0A8A4TVJ6_SULCO|nr:protein phosphatase CheZ [Sulfidibacter corallicola]QTD53530.1 protein phosphatase CheZ [Sulfidibacter corallicola]
MAKNDQNNQSAPDLDPHLKSIVSTVKNITEGKWHQDLDVKASGMIGELAYYLNHTLKNLRKLDKSLGANVEDTPRAMSEVQAVIDHTEKATILVLDKADDILARLSQNREMVDQLKQISDEAGRSELTEKLSNNNTALEKSAYDIINAMEFQDVTQQKIMSIMSCLEGIEERLIDLLIIFKIKEGRENKNENVEILKNLHDEEFDTSNKQGLVDQLLAEFGI